MKRRPAAELRAQFAPAAEASDFFADHAHRDAIPPPSGAPKTGVRKRKPDGARNFARAVDEVRDRFVGDEAGGNWEGATPSTLVGLYAVMHERVYGVKADDLASEWMMAVSSARRLLEKQFAGDADQVIAFLRWTWRRARNRHGKGDPENVFRIGWRYQFGAKLVVEYRIALRQKR